MNVPTNAATLPTSEATSPAGASTDVLRVEGLRVDFATEHGWANVVDDVSFSVGRDEIVGLVGESGSGKTVTGLSILGLVPSPPGRRSGGRVWLGEEDVTEASPARLRQIRGNEISMIFQEPMTSLNPAFTVGDQIAETVRHHRGVSRRKAMDRAVEMLDLVGIPHARRRTGEYPHEFSGGMRQRVMIAMALACDPRVLIADEPTTALDVTVQAQILDLLVSMRDELGMGIVFITHDLGVVAEICDRVVVMYAGRVIETGTAIDLFDQPQHPYTEGLLTAMPQLGARGTRLASIPGRTPEPWAMPSGCRFSPRCSYSQDACAVEPAPLVRLEPSAHESACRRVADLTLEGTR